MKKHENNFFLYALGSGMLMVFAMLLISEASLERKELLLANTISVTALVEETKEIQSKGYISGAVFQDKDNDGIYTLQKDIPVFNREVFLWKENETKDLVFVKKTYTDEKGKYLFETQTPGNFFIKITEEDGEKIISPDPSIDGFSYSSHSARATIPSGNYYIAGLNFALEI